MTKIFSENSNVGLVMGKFLPFHRGHHHLIQTAITNCDQVVVVVVASLWHNIAAELRAKWIKQIFPTVRVMILEQEKVGLPDWDSEGWARETVKLLGSAPDVVFTSEEYGEAWAANMGSKHFLVDMERSVVPVSGTQVRENPQANLRFLDEPVRQWFEDHPEYASPRRG